jgi:NAD(P)-dependent dehydrogenase (short-subunit alcohol dehydrogenase family)
MTTIVMTGGTRGLGEVAANRMAAAPKTRLLLGARGSAPADAQVLPLELCRLDSVRAFATETAELVGHDDIDALVCNAGLSFRSVEERTPDGFETTFAVNHLAHYLLIRLLLPKLAHGARVVLTTSGTHDPAEKAPIPPPHHADARRLADPSTDPQLDAKSKAAGNRAYSASKLCNLLTARALAAQPEAIDRKFTVVAYDPGPTPGTGLSRSYTPALRATWWLLGTPIGRVVPMLNSRAAAGGGLANLALGSVTPPPGEIYARTVKNKLVWAQPSELARDDRVRDALWEDSAALVGLSTVTG